MNTTELQKEYRVVEKTNANVRITTETKEEFNGENNNRVTNKDERTGTSDLNDLNKENQKIRFAGNNE